MTEEINIEKFDDYSTNHLIPYERNSKIHTPEQIDRIANSIIEFGFNNPVLCDEANIILAGHGRVLAAEKLGIEKIPVWKIFGLTEGKKRAFRIADNKLNHDTSFDENLLREELEFLINDSFDIGKFGLDDFDDLIFDQNSEIENISTYSKKIKSPVYEIKGECPTEEECYSNEKQQQLIKEINKLSNIPEAMRNFLTLASYRHIKFNYQKIAEYYAHASKEVQQLMESSALIIIDFNKAIENGFVEMSKEIANSYLEDQNVPE